QYASQSGPLTGILYWMGVPGELKYDATTSTWRARPEGSREYFVFDATYKPVSVESIDQTGFSLLFTFDASGRLSQVKNNVATGRYLNVAYGGDGRISRTTDPTGRHVDYTYDTDGYLTKVTNAAGQDTHYTYATGEIRGTRPIAQITDHWGRVITDVTYYP